MIRSSILGAAALVSVLCVSVTAQATENPSGDSHPHGNVADAPLPSAPGDITPAQMDDIAFIAREEGIPLEEAIAKIGWQESFSEMSFVIAEEYPESYAGARIEPEGQPWIAFSSEIPSAASALIQDFNQEVLSQGRYLDDSGEPREVAIYENRGFSESELTERLREAHFAAVAQREIVADASSGYDIASGDINLNIELAPGVEASSYESVIEELYSLSAIPREVTITIQKSLGLVDDANIIGGDAMTSCTSGFTVIKSNTRGIATAGHCNNTQSLHGPLSFKGEHVGTWGDMQWHTSTQYEYDDFFGGGTTTHLYDIRDVNNRGNALEGQYICRNGKTTFKHCDNVYQLNHCSGSKCGLTAMHNRKAAGGDSGGPWYYGNTAYGLHQGGKFWNFKNRDMFTPQANLDNGISGLVIATS